MSEDEIERGRLIVENGTHSPRNGHAPYADIPPPEEPPDYENPPEDTTDWRERTIEVELDKLRIRSEARRRLDDETRQQVDPPPVKSLDVLLSEPDTPTRYRIDQVAPLNGRIILSAQYKAGKTTVIGNLMRSLADGEPFLSRFTVHTPAQHLVLIDDELSEDTVRLWLRDQNITNTAAVADVVSLRGKVAAFNLLDDTCRNQWAERLRDLGCDYLILDCLRPVLDALGLDENRDAGKFLVEVDALLAEAGIPDAALVQHMGHANERARGDSRLQDWPDAIWRIVRETDEPDSARFFSAYGRDVSVPEGRLTLDPATRHLSYAAGSRGDAKVRDAYIDVIKLLAAIAKGDPEARGAHSGCFSKNQIEGELSAPGYGDHSDGHTQKAVRAALAEAVKAGTVKCVPGPRRAQLHCIAYPCSECGLPVATQRERHESCPSGPDDLDLQ